MKCSPEMKKWAQLLRFEVENSVRIHVEPSVQCHDVP